MIEDYRMSDMVDSLELNEISWREIVYVISNLLTYIDVEHKESS